MNNIKSMIDSNIICVLFQIILDSINITQLYYSLDCIKNLLELTEEGPIFADILEKINGIDGKKTLENLVNYKNERISSDSEDILRLYLD